MPDISLKANPALPGGANTNHAPRSAVSSTKMLLASSDAIILRSWQLVAAKTGATTVGEAHYGKQLTALAQKTAPDVCLIDAEELSGVTAAVKQISDLRLCPVILFTSAKSGANSALVLSFSSVLACIDRAANERQILSAIAVVVFRWKEMEIMGKELARLKETLTTRKALDRAKGILAEKFGLTENEAHRKLQQTAMKNRLSLLEVAERTIRKYQTKGNTA